MGAFCGLSLDRSLKFNAVFYLRASGFQQWERVFSCDFLSCYFQYSSSSAGAFKNHFCSKFVKQPYRKIPITHTRMHMAYIVLSDVVYPFQNVRCMDFVLSSSLLGLTNYIWIKYRCLQYRIINYNLIMYFTIDVYVLIW